MFRIPLLCTALAALAVLPPAARAQDEKPDPGVEATKRLLKKAEDEYRLFIKRPETILDYWAALKYEMQLGKFDLAALHLKLLLDKHEKAPDDGNKELLKLEAAEGLAALLRLRAVKKWSDHPPFQKEAVDNVEKFIDRVTEAVEKNLSDPARIQKFIGRLNAETPEERAFARMQLQKSSARAVPYLVEALRVNVGKPLYDRLRELMLEMDSSIVPGYLEVLKAHDAADYRDIEPRVTLIKLTLQRGDERIVPYLWHISGSPKYPAPVRREAERALTIFLKTDKVNLTPPQIALTKLAEDYYYHRVRFPLKTVKIWPWNGKVVAPRPIELTAAQAEYLYGQRHAREALDLDPKYQPAQAALLSLVLERELEPTLDQLLLNPMPPALRNLLATLDPELVGNVLEKALDDHKAPAILAIVQSLGERGDARAARLSPGGTPHGLLRALFYPDRRVQLASAQATVRIPLPPPVAAARVVDIYSRFLAADSTVPRALAAYIPPGQAMELRQQLKAAGYDGVVVGNVKEAFVKLRAAADYDFIVLGRALPRAELPFVLAQLRGDSDQGGLPVFIVTDNEKDDDLARLARKYRAVHVIGASALSLAEEFKTRLDTAIKTAQGAKLSADERKAFSRSALDALWSMARGEYAGYDIRPAEAALVHALRNPDAAALALETLGRLPGSENQHRLAGLVLDETRGKLRVPAARELVRHVQKYGLLLDKKSTNDLKASYQKTADATLKGELAIVTGLMRTPTPQQAGIQLFEFRPDAPAPPMEKKEKDEK